MSSIESFARLVQAWNLSAENAQGLLNGQGFGSLSVSKEGVPTALDEERLARISYLLGIYKALHEVYGDKLADEWVHLPNRNAMFGGATPLSYMLTGGMEALRLVRKLLDARRAGA
jgi:hypothetical protein